MNKKYTPREIRFVEKNITGRSYTDLADMFNRHFHTALTRRQVKYIAESHGLENGRDTRYAPGHPASNIGRTVFKPGHKTYNYLPPGTVVVNSYGWVEVKNRKGRWKLKHHIIWKAANGKIPKGHVLLFADGNRLNFELDNLLLVSNSELCVMATQGLITADKNLTKAGKLVADIKLLINERKRRRGNRNAAK
jgi:hypothetical protein